MEFEINPNESIEVRAFRDRGNRRIGISIDKVLVDNRGKEVSASVAVLDKFKEVGLYEALQPTVDLSPDAAQTLMDNLWDCGIRPTQGEGSAGQLSAVEGHLTDMRQIVFDKLKIDKP